VTNSYIPNLTVFHVVTVCSWDYCLKLIRCICPLFKSLLDALLFSFAVHLFNLGELLLNLSYVGAQVGNHSSHHGVSSDVENRLHASEEPVNGNDEFKAVGYTGRVENSVVGSNDQNQATRRYRRTSSATNGRDDRQEQILRKLDFDSIVRGQPVIECENV
jgi:hypothetical protein